MVTKVIAGELENLRFIIDDQDGFHHSNVPYSGLLILFSLEWIESFGRV